MNIFLKSRKAADGYIEHLRANGYVTEERERDNGISIEAWRPVFMTPVQRLAIEQLGRAIESCANVGVLLESGSDGERYLSVEDFDSYELGYFDSKSISQFLERN